MRCGVQRRRRVRRRPLQHGRQRRRPAHPRRRRHRHARRQPGDRGQRAQGRRALLVPRRRTHQRPGESAPHRHPHRLGHLIHLQPERGHQRGTHSHSLSLIIERILFDYSSLVCACVVSARDWQEYGVGERHAGAQQRSRALHRLARLLLQRVLRLVSAKGLERQALGDERQRAARRRAHKVDVQGERRVARRRRQALEGGRGQPARRVHHQRASDVHDPHRGDARRQVEAVRGQGRAARVRAPRSVRAHLSQGHRRKLQRPVHHTRCVRHIQVRRRLQPRRLHAPLLFHPGERATLHAHAVRALHTHRLSVLRQRLLHDARRLLLQLHSTLPQRSLAEQVEREEDARRDNTTKYVVDNMRQHNTRIHNPHTKLNKQFTIVAATKKYNFLR